MPKAKDTRSRPLEEMVTGMMDEMREVKKELAELRARNTASNSQQNVPSQEPHVAQTAPASSVSSMDPQAGPSCSLLAPEHNPVMKLTPIPSSELPDIDIVPGHVKRDIVRGKDVNLAILLLPVKDRKAYSADKDVQFGSEIFTIKAKGDSRLTRDLTISEFICAFNIYKRLMCAEYPHRRAELDKYMSFIIEINQKFPGFAFYHYHLQFSAKAAQYCEVGQRIDWSAPDSTMLSTIVAGLKANVCNLCQAFDHTAAFCGLNSDKTPPRPAPERATFTATSTATSTAGATANYGGPGKRICRFFQAERGCAKGNCSYQHICAKCFSPDHAAHVCRRGMRQ
jgi:hypothetical protein